MSAYDMAQLEALANKATPGPWVWSATSDAGYDDCGPNLETAGNEWEVCKFNCLWDESDGNSRGARGVRGEHEHRVHSEVIGAWGYDHYGVDVDDKDAAFIAACDPDTIKTLITEIRRLRAALDAAQPTITDDAGFDALPDESVVLSNYAIYQKGDGIWLRMEPARDVRTPTLPATVLHYGSPAELTWGKQKEKPNEHP